MMIRLYNKTTKDSIDFKDVCTVCEEPSKKHISLIFLDGHSETFNWADTAVIHIKQEKIKDG